MYVLHYDSLWAWAHLLILQKDLEYVVGERDILNTQLSLLPSHLDRVWVRNNMTPNRKSVMSDGWMDGGLTDRQIDR